MTIPNSSSRFRRSLILLSALLLGVLAMLAWLWNTPKTSVRPPTDPAPFVRLVGPPLESELKLASLEAEQSSYYAMTIAGLAIACIVTATVILLMGSVPRHRGTDYVGNVIPFTTSTVDTEVDDCFAPPKYSVA